MNKFLTTSMPTANTFATIIVSAVLGLYFIGVPLRLYSQTDTWRPSEDALFDGGMVWSLFADDSVTLAGTSLSLFRSLDNGNSWQQVSFGNTIQEQQIRISSIVRHHNALFAGTYHNDILCSYDNGNSWSPSHLRADMMANDYYYPFRLLSFGNTLFVFREQNSKLYRSNNDGQSWDEVTNLPFSSIASLNSPLAGLASHSGKIFLARGKAVFYSDNNGASWKPSGDIGISDFEQIKTMKTTQQHIVIMSTGGSLYFLSLETMKWQKRLPPSGINPTDIAESAPNLLLIGGGSMSRQAPIVFSSPDNGISWSELSSGLDPQITFGIANYIAANTTTVFIGTPGGVFKMEKGQAWQFASRGLRAHDIRTMCATEKSLLLGMETRIIRTSSTGISIPVFQPRLDERIIGHIGSLTYMGGTLLGTRFGELLRSTNDGQTWQALPSPGVVSKLYGASGGFYAATLNGIYFSPTAEFWQRLTNLPEVPFRDIVSSGGALFALTDAGQLFTSKDNGTTWKNLQQVFSDGVKALTTVGLYIFVQTAGQKIFRSDDNGDSWTSATGTTPLAFTSLFALNKTTLFAFAVNTPGIFRSNDMGSSWHSFTVGLPDRIFVSTIARNNTSLYIGTFNGLYSTSIEKAVDVSTDVAFTKEHSMLAFPNPTLGTGTISYRLNKTENVRISLLNALGQTVEILLDTVHNAGDYALPFDATLYAAGIYTIRIETGAQIQQVQLIVAQ